MHDQTQSPPRLFRVSFDLLVGHGVTATTPQVTPIDEDFPAGEGTHAITTSFGLLAGHALADGRHDAETDPHAWYRTLAVYEVARGLLDAMGTDSGSESVSGEHPSDTQ